MKIFTKMAFSCAVVLLLGNQLSAQNYFTAVSPAAMSQSAQAQVAKKVGKMSLFTLDEVSMRKYLLVAPMEFHNNGKFTPLQIPLPDGTVETFNLVESPVLSPEMATLHPEIKTYTGNGTNDKKLVIRISLTSDGFNAIILNVNGSEGIYFEKLSGNTYYNYFTKDALQGNNATGSSRPFCGAEALPVNVQKIQSLTNGSTTGPRTNSTGTTLRTFRLAMSADGEFTAVHGGTKAGGYAAIIGYVNRLKAFYRNELSIDFTLVSNSNIVYTDTATDPFTGYNDVVMLDQNQKVQDDSIGTANYDVGFVMNANAPGYSPSGVAYLGSLCDPNFKAGGEAAEGDLSIYSQLYCDKTLFHEMGHKVNMTHSYNSNIPVCTSREQTTSVEPGSGATIMSYGFKCNDATADDDYFESTTVGLILGFHSVSYNQAASFLSTLVGGASVATGNAPPVITMPAAYTVPKQTPFSLTGSATDANGDALTYSWEGTNVGAVTDISVSTMLDPSKPPFFRSFDPVTTPTRYYPQLDSILNNNNVSRANKLPSVSVVTTHSFTVRDNHASGGGVTNGTVNITVDATTGPFLITNDPTGSFPGLAPMLVTWSVNGTGLSTPLVNILLSTDGGQTFPTTLLTTANIGTAPIVLPNVSTSQARIKVAAANNIFFDISNNNFTISSILPVALTGFTATLQNKKDVLLNWQTATETNSKGYEVEMASGNTPTTFTDIAFVASKGTTTTASNYSFIVPNLAPNTYYFRLRMIDMDGTVTYSAVQSVTVVGDRALISVYPTPVHSQLTVVLSAGMQNAQLQLVNSLGQTLLVNTTASGSSRILNMGNLPAGLYVLKVVDGANVVTSQKVVKE